MSIRSVQAIRYVTPLREGGSLPAIVEADDDGTYVLKFRGAGQGPKALIAELIGGELGRAIGLPVPEIVFVDLDPDLARTEPDQEIQDLLRASGGLNLALDYLPGSLTFDPVVETINADLAAKIVWFDAFITNVDRTPRNPNMLVWHNKPWLIDHGACLYFHHSWDNYLDRSQDKFAAIKDHMLLPAVSSLEQAGEEILEKLSPEVLHQVVDLIPESWLLVNAPFETAEAHKDAYVAYLSRRLAPPHLYIEEAIRAKSMSI